MKGFYLVSRILEALYNCKVNPSPVICHFACRSNSNSVREHHPKVTASKPGASLDRGIRLGMKEASTGRARSLLQYRLQPQLVPTQQPAYTYI